MDTSFISSETSIDSQIGALELGGDLTGFGDGVLEASADPGPRPTAVVMCGPTFVCRIDDGALEAAGVAIAGPLTSVSPCRPTTQGGCPRTILMCVSDSALEAAGADMAQPVTNPPQCSARPVTLRCVSDSALEAAGADMAQPITSAPPCRPRTLAMCVSDAVLEAAAARELMGPPRPTHGVCLPQTLVTACVSDAVLEAAAARELMGPPTGPRWTGACCGRIDDDALETAGTSPKLTSWPVCAPNGDDGALEAAGANIAQPTVPQCGVGIPTIRCVGDGMLLLAGDAVQPQTMPPFCPR